MKTLLKILIIATISVTICWGYSYAGSDKLKRPKLLDTNSYADATTVPDDYPTIQLAIDNAISGGTVLVLRDTGPYNEDVTMAADVDLVAEGTDYLIEAKRNVTIIGKVSTADNTELKGFTIQKEAADNEPVLDISGSNILIEKCRIENTNALLGTQGLGIRINPSASNITVRNTIVYVGNHSDYDRGIYINQAVAPIAIESNTVHINADPLATSSLETACIYSENSDYTLRNNILTLNDASLNAISSGSDTTEVAYNCILGRLSPLTLAHKGTLFASPSYVDATNGDFLLVEMPPVEIAPKEYKQGKSPSIAFDSGDPASPFDGEVQLIATNKAIDMGAYGKTQDTVMTVIRGNATLDGWVTGADYTIWADHYKHNVGYLKGDFNEDGRADGADYTIWADHYMYRIVE